MKNVYEKKNNCILQSDKKSEDMSELFFTTLYYDIAAYEAEKPMTHTQRRSIR